jgi:hypothetical protein
MKRLSRRGFLILGGAAGATGAGAVAAARARRREPSPAAAQAPAPTTTTPQPTSTTVPAGPRRAGSRWSDPASWKGGVPGPDRVAVVTRTITLDVDAKVAGVRIEPGGRLVFDPRASRRLESAGNVVVLGRLVMRPASAEVGHRLVFTGADEAKAVGATMEVEATDVGLWVMGRGVLEVAGADKLAWARVTGDVGQGATTITLQADPAGWRPGDELVLTPTQSPTVTDHATAFDPVRVRAIRGRTVTLDRPVRHPHPSLDAGTGVGGGPVHTAEVLNLTRNVGVEGVASRRAHVFVRSSRPQTLKGAELRHLGPRKVSGRDARGPVTKLVKGRYPLHFHMCHDGSRGSVVEGVVVRQAGSHAFVAHESHGVAFRDCVAYDVLENAYWWDGPPGTTTGGATDPGSISNDVRYERCVAALVRYEPDYDAHDLTGFSLGRGTGNVCRGCVAVGVQGNVNASGFQWGENQEGPGLWDFRDNVAHNNARHGIFWWQVTARHHTVFDFVAYRNGGSGIFNGSYGDNNHFERCVLVENAETQFFGWAESGQRDPSDPNSHGQETPQHLVDSVMDARGLTDYACILAGRSVVESANSVGQVTGNVFRGARKACVAISFDFHDFGPYRTRWRLDGNRYQGNRYWFDGSSHPETMVQTEDGRLGHPDRPEGTLKPAWNARIT